MWFQFSEDNSKIITNPYGKKVPEILLDLENNPKIKLIKTDKNGTLYYEYRHGKCESCEGVGTWQKESIKTCYACNGSGKFENSSVDEDGVWHYNTEVCLRCNGVGKWKEEYTVKCYHCKGSGETKPEIYKIYTYKYSFVLEKRSIKTEERQKKRYNEQFLEERGINEDGTTYIYLGDTYPVKDELMCEGATYDRQIRRMHSKEAIEGYSCEKVKIPLKVVNGYISYDLESPDWFKIQFAEKTEEFFAKRGINEDGTTFIYLGNVYPVKDELKAKGATFDNIIKTWHSKNAIEGYRCIKIVVPLKIYPDGFVRYDTESPDWERVECVKKQSYFAELDPDLEFDPFVFYNISDTKEGS